MIAYAQRFVRLDTTRRALFGRASGVYGDEVRSFALAFVFEHSQERPPRGPGSIPRVAREFDQSLRVQVLDGHKVVLAGVVVRQFVEEISTLAFQVGVSSGDRLALFLPVVRAVFLPRKFALGTFQSFALVGEVQRLDSGSISIMGVLQDTNVNPNDMLWILRLLRGVFVHVDTEGGEPFTRGFLLDRDLFDGRIIGNVSVVENR